jgi:hypothetical protein
MVYDFYNANSGKTEQSGLATLPLSEWPGVNRPVRIISLIRLFY